MGKKRAHAQTKAKDAHESALEEDLFGKDIVDAIGFERPKIEDDVGQVKKGKLEEKEEVAAWHDDDDDEVEIDLNAVARLRKLKTSQNEDTQGVVKGKVLSDRLKERFQSSQLSWSHTFDEDVGGGDGGLDVEADILRSSQSLAVRNSKGSGRGSSGRGRGSSGGALPSGKIDISRLTDGNADGPSKDTITTVDFHSSGQLLLTGGSDKHLRFFRIDGEVNEKQLAVKIADLPISTASFVGNTSEVVIAGRKPFFYSYEATTGTVNKYPGLMTRKGLKSHERMYVSPDGSRLAFAGESGYVHIVDGRQKMWIGDVKMNSGCRAACFADDRTLITSGVDADIYIWDLRKAGGRCLSRVHHDDGTPTSALAVSPAFGSQNGGLSSSFHLSVGTESGVVTTFEMNVGLATALHPVKTMMNLTTKITCMGYNPSGEILAMGSDHKRDQLRMAHLPSCSIFTNWPTEQSPVRRANCLSFSPNGHYFAAGNNRGRVLLYRINHFA